MTSDEQKDSDSWTEPDQQSGGSPKLNMKSPGATPNVVSSIQSPFAFVSEKPKLGSITDQLSKVLPPDDGFPDLIVFVSLENIGAGIFTALAKCNIKVLGIDSESDIRVALPHIVGKVQKFCNNNAKTPPPLNIVVVGSDSFLSAVTKNYVTQLSTRPHDWQNYFSFLYAPFSSKF